MAWLLIFLALATLGAVGAAAALGPSRDFPARIAAAVLVLGMLTAGAVLLWRPAIVALAIASVCSLAVGVMFQRVAPARAISAALGAFVLMFAFSWLALQLAPPFLYGEESDLTRWLSRVGERLDLPDPTHASPALLAAAGAACLLAAACLRRWLRAIAVFAGALLLLVYLPPLLGEVDFAPLAPGGDPNLRLLALGLLVAGIVVLARRARRRRGP